MRLYGITCHWVGFDSQILHEEEVRGWEEGVPGLCVRKSPVEWEMSDNRWKIHNQFPVNEAVEELDIYLMNIQNTMPGMYIFPV